jgi:hypothetical protein
MLAVDPVLMTLQAVTAIGCVLFALGFARLINQKKPRINPVLVTLYLSVTGAMMIWPLIFMIR